MINTNNKSEISDRSVFLDPRSEILSPQPLALSPLAIYVHTPFCPTKCGYCDFNSYAMSGEIMERTTRAIVREIETSPLRGRPAKTIFFGGGTPTYLSSEQLLSILEAVLRVHPALDGAEITSEANPGTADASKFSAMRGAGFNRISLGAQSFLDSDLVRLGRVHRAGEIERAVSIARDAGFENLNLDLMFALPGQSRHAWSSNLMRALAMKPQHLSLYCLTLEPNTAFYKQHLAGQLTLPDDDEQVAMYDECLALTAEAGYEQYEISNFSLPGRECQHNLCYWRAEEYAGYGPGAVGAFRDQRSGVRDQLSVISNQLSVISYQSDSADHRLPITHYGVRYTNLKHPERYCAAVENGEAIAFESEELTPEKLRIEKIMLGLRMNEGLSTLGLSLSEAAVDKLVERGWVSVDRNRVRLTSLGKHFCSEVALEFI